MTWRDFLNSDYGKDAKADIDWYLIVQLLKAGDELGIGKVLRLHLRECKLNAEDAEEVATPPYSEPNTSRSQDVKEHNRLIKR